jgi:segregation and condensation protein A
VLKRFDEARAFGDIVDDRFTVSDKIEFLINKIEPGESLSLQSLFEKATSKVEVIVTFLALLELMKMNQFCARQSGLLGQINIERTTPE